MTALVDSMRAFVALNLDVATVRAIADLARDLRVHPLAPAARWVAPTKMHVTLKFLGAIDVGLAPAIRDSLAGLIAARASPRLAIRKPTAFPTPESARVIVLEIDDVSGGVAQIEASVEKSLASLGFLPDPRAFRPHVTLARTNASVDSRAWLASIAVPSRDAVVTELVFYRSDLTRSGAEYTAVARFGFAAGPAAKSAGEE